MRRACPPASSVTLCALAVYMQAGRGLAAAHANGVVHRDFKPENAIIGADGRVRVIDFGLAWVQSIVDTSHVGGIVELDAMHLTQAGHIVGTPLYMAPEQADGESVDARADQFAFCVALYEALFRQQPFADETIVSRLADIRRDNVTPPAGHDVPPRLVQAVLRGLHPHPKDRWATMNDLLDALEQHARRRLVFTVGVVLAVVVALAVVYAIWAAR